MTLHGFGTKAAMICPLFTPDLTTPCLDIPHSSPAEPLLSAQKVPAPLPLGIALIIPPPHATLHSHPFWCVCLFDELSAFCLLDIGDTESNSSPVRGTPSYGVSGRSLSYFISLFLVYFFPDTLSPQYRVPLSRV